MICISLRSIWINRGSSLEVAEHQALLKFKRPFPALAFTGSEVEEAVMWASETNCFSTPRRGNSSELRKKSGFTKKNCLYFSHMCEMNLLVLLFTPFLFLRILCYQKRRGCNQLLLSGLSFFTYMDAWRFRVFNPSTCSWDQSVKLWMFHKLKQIHKYVIYLQNQNHLSIVYVSWFRRIKWKKKDLTFQHTWIEGVSRTY